MKVAIIDGRAVDIVSRELDDNETNRITAALAERGIHVTPVVDVFHTLHLWALGPVTTEQEVHALAAFRACTDCRIAWHAAVA